MASTPTIPKMNPTQSAIGLRLTPSNSPYYRSSGTKSPSKASRVFAESSVLSLRKIVGSTTNAPTGLDGSRKSKSFAYTAGAAAVLVDLEQGDSEPVQRFFRARPTAVPFSIPTTSFQSPTPGGTLSTPRGRNYGSYRDAGRMYDSPGDGMDSPSLRTWTARERVKAATCVSLSGNGQFLAVGETGYNPRVLVFSTAENASQDIPLSAASEHSFGICAVAFSPDSRYLASLGATTDGYLYIWSVNPKTGGLKLHSSGKCTSFVRSLIWLSPKSLLTAGTRHVRVWRIEDTKPPSPSKNRFGSDYKPPGTPSTPGPKSLSGRNCLLGDLLDTNFTCAVAVEHDQAIVCSQTGDMCLVDDSDKTQKFKKVARSGGPISCTAFDETRRKLWLARVDGNLCAFDLSTEFASSSFEEHVVLEAQSDLEFDVAIAVTQGCLTTVDSHHRIKVLSVMEDLQGLSKPLLSLPAHSDAVMGVMAAPLPNDLAAYVTWCRGGTVFSWDDNGHKRNEFTIELEQFPEDFEDFSNELRVLQLSQKADLLVSGDRIGVMRIIDGRTGRAGFSTKAHGSEIMDITLAETSRYTLVASCSRDRTIQVFRRLSDSWNLVQTLDEHTGCINRLLFCNDGETLMSSSSDRTMIVRKLVSKEADDDSIAFLPLQTIGLKAGPVSLDTSPVDSDVVIVSTLDKCVHRYQISSGRHLSLFRVSDGDGGDSAVLDSLTWATFGSQPNPVQCIIGISSTDKSLRIYDEVGTLIAKEWGHTEGVSSLALVSPRMTASSTVGQHQIVTTGVDGTIMVYDLTPKGQSPLKEEHDMGDASQESPSTAEAVASRAPLRRVLSKQDLAQFQKSLGRDAPPVPRSGSCSPPRNNRSPPRSLRKKTSNFSLSQKAKSSMPFGPVDGNSSTPPSREAVNQKTRLNGCPSPSSPQYKTVRAGKSNRPSLDRFRTKSAGNLTETGQLCQFLRSYRANLASSSTGPRMESLRELEKELDLTRKVIGEKVLKPDDIDNKHMSRLLDSYSGRLMEMIDEKLTFNSRSQDSRLLNDTGLVTPPHRTKI